MVTLKPIFINPNSTYSLAKILTHGGMFQEQIFVKDLNIQYFRLMLFCVLVWKENSDLKDSAWLCWRKDRISLWKFLSLKYIAASLVLVC